MNAAHFWITVVIALFTGIATVANIMTAKAVRMRARYALLDYNLRKEYYIEKLNRTKNKEN